MSVLRGRENLKKTINKLLLKRKPAWRKALPFAIRLVDEYHEDYKLDAILMHVKVEENPLEGDASSVFLRAYMLYYGLGGAEGNNEEVFRCLSRAAEMGHVFARYLCGLCLCLGLGTAKDNKKGLQMYKSAAEAGCGRASYWMGYILKRSQQYREAVHYYANAITLQYDCRGRREQLLLDHPVEACIWGQWKPRFLEHLQVITPVKEAMMQALFIFRCASSPIRLPRHVSYMILAFVCTRNGWTF